MTMRETYEIDITLLEPALFTRIDGEPNSAVSYGFAPGSALRGALIAAYGQGGRLDTNAPLIRLLFFSNAVRFLNGYPRAQHGPHEIQRALPVPLSWRASKSEQRELFKDPRGRSTIYDLADPYASSDPELPTDLKATDSQYWTRFATLSDVTTLPEPARQLSIHTQREARRGRAVAGQGEVFRYNALRDGVTLRALILCDWPDAPDAEPHVRDARAWLGHLPDRLSIGGARSAGYGLAKIAVQGLRGVDAATRWREASESFQTGASAVITLLSDALVTDRYGVCTPTPSALSDAIFDVCGERVDLRPIATATRLSGGFNRVWGLPLPQQTAIAQGSVFVVTQGALSADARAALEWAGIGDRRNEGFGRIAIGLHGAQLRLSPESAAAARDVIALRDSLKIKDHAASAALARQTTERLLRRRLDALLDRHASMAAQKLTRASASQLSRMASLVRDELNSVIASRQRTSTLDQQLTNLTNNRAAQRQLGTSTDADTNKPLSWVRGQIAEKGKSCALFNNIDQLMPRVADVSATLDDALRYEYALRLVNETLALAGKRKREAGGTRKS
jgi:CRISPR-associated protein Csx10